MIFDPSKHSIPEQFQHLYTVIASERFLKMQGLGNEVPFFICSYPPGNAVKMQQQEKQLVNKLERNGVSVLVINLYDLSIELLKDRGIWESVLEIEEKVSKTELKELLQGVLDSKEHLVPAIADKMREDDFDVMFITGVGEVFPFIRSHSVLTNLQSTAKERPTLMFFPGTYRQLLESGASLDLFDRLHDDKYYRAFNIYHVEV